MGIHLGVECQGRRRCSSLFLFSTFFPLLTRKPYIPGEDKRCISRTAQSLCHVVSTARSAFPPSAPVVQTLPSSEPSSDTAPSSRKSSLIPPHQNSSLLFLCSYDSRSVPLILFYLDMFAISLCGVSPLLGQRPFPHQDPNLCPLAGA